MHDLHDAVDTSLKINSGGSVFILTHLVPRDNGILEKLFSDISIVKEPIKRGCLSRVFNQTVAAIAWLIKRIRNIRDPFPYILFKQWYKVVFSRS